MRQVLLLCLLLSAPALAGPPGRVVLVTIDGLLPETYLSQDYRVPQLKRLAREGTWAAAALPCFPSLTYPNHTTLATGQTSAGHGVHSNRPYDQGGAWYWEARWMEAPPLWRLARDQGLTSAVLAWPVSVGAAADWCLPEIFHVEGVNQGTTMDLVIRHSTPGLLQEFDRETAIDLDRPPESYPEWDEWIVEAAVYLESRYQPDLLMVHLIGVDIAQHDFGPESSEARAAMGRLDTLLGRLVGQLDPSETTLIVTGDHGFQSCHTTLQLGPRLRSQGWERSVGANAGGGSAAIYCTDPALEDQVLEFLRAQARGRYTLLDRQALQKLEAFPGALCGLAAWPGYIFGTALEGPKEGPSDSKAHHGYLPEKVPAGLLIWGRGVEPGGRLGVVRLLDVAPTVADLLGLEGLTGPGKPLLFTGSESPSQKP